MDKAEPRLSELYYLVASNLEVEIQRMVSARDVLLKRADDLANAEMQERRAASATGTQEKT